MIGQSDAKYLVRPNFLDVVTGAIVFNIVWLRIGIPEMTIEQKDTLIARNRIAVKVLEDDSMYENATEVKAALFTNTTSFQPFDPECLRIGS